ncbi:MAG TPA: glycosyltransferase family 39 protein, partial [Vicinamibacterales bacterium]|nr:glycosyltransferase family 39 protein [Vicinamibacterales bacterium]
MPAVVIFFIALLLRLLHLWQLRSTPFFDVLLGDANGYDQWAQRLAAGDWIGTDVFYQAPLYPYFLGVIYALFDRDLLVVRIIQALIGSASCALLGLAATRLFSPRVGLAAGLGLALWAPAIFFDSLLQKSVLDMFFLCLSLWLIAGIRDQGSGIRAAFPLGGSLAAFALTRENGLLLIAVVAIWLGIQHRRQLAYFAAGLAIVFAPVVVRNYSIDGGIYLTTSQFGSNFYIGNNAAADGTYASIRFGRGAPEFERIDATELAEESLGRTLSPAEISSFWTNRALDYIKAQPGDWLALTGRKILLLFNRSEMVDTESLESYAEFSWPLRILGRFTHFGVLVPIAMAGVVLAWPHRRRLWVIYAMALTYAASVVMF